jgi:quercetin dioxygenase-like cupin family protein
VGHTAIDVLGAVEVRAGSIVSKVVFRDETLNVTVFGIGAGEGLTEHTASRAAIIEVLSGRIDLTVDGEAYEAGAGFWLRMAEGTPHALVAKEPTVMLLTLIGA